MGVSVTKFFTFLVNRTELRDTTSWNRGNGRAIFHSSVPGTLKVHRSVKMHSELRNDYTPHARLTKSDGKGPCRLGHAEWNKAGHSNWAWVPSS